MSTTITLQAPASPAVEHAIDQLYRVSALLDYMRLHFWDSQQLTVTQLRLLGILLDDEGLSNADLADRLLVTRPSVSALLDRLERGGFIRRETSPVDRRGIRIFLEPRGREAVSYARHDARAFARDLFAGLDESVIESIGAAFETLATHGRERRAAALAAHRACEPAVRAGE
jgi:DNA-binding MarR family transcriptional regulator